MYFEQPDAVTIINKDGVKVPFGSSDVKALIILYIGQYDEQSAATEFLGQRCKWVILTICSLLLRLLFFKKHNFRIYEAIPKRRTQRIVQIWMQGRCMSFLQINSVCWMKASLSIEIEASKFGINPLSISLRLLEKWKVSVIQTIQKQFNKQLLQQQSLVKKKNWHHCFFKKNQTKNPFFRRKRNCSSMESASNI